MTNLIEAYKRLRHKHGYGVHSPFAYSLVKGVFDLGRGYGYYAESGIRTDARCRREMNTRVYIHRLESWLKRNGFADTHVCRQNGPDTRLDDLLRFISEPGRTLWLEDYPSEWRNALFESMPGGVMLYDPKRMLVVTRSEMQPVAYSFKF